MFHTALICKGTEQTHCHTPVPTSDTCFLSLLQSNTFHPVQKSRREMMMLWDSSQPTLLQQLCHEQVTRLSCMHFLLYVYVCMPIYSYRWLKLQECRYTLVIFTFLLLYKRVCICKILLNWHKLMIFSDYLQCTAELSQSILYLQMQLHLRSTMQ